MFFFCYQSSMLKHVVNILLIDLYKQVEILTRPVKQIQNLLIQDKNFIMAAS